MEIWRSHKQGSGKRLTYRMTSMDLGKEPLSTSVDLKKDILPIDRHQIYCAEAQAHVI